MSSLRSLDSSLSSRVLMPVPRQPASTLLQCAVAAMLLAASLPGMAALSQTQVLSAVDHTVDTPLNIVDERFGEAVAVSGNWMAVGSPAAGSTQGSVSLYERVSGAWTLRQRLAQPSAQAGSGFGAAVDIHEAGGLVTVIVGAPQFDVAQNNQGRAYIFSDTNAGAALSFVSTSIDAPIVEANGHFGASVALFGDLAAIAAPNTGLSDDGLVSIRGRNVGGSNAWGQATPLKTGPASSRFGTSVDLHGEYLIVGAPLAENASAIRTGLAYVYRQDLGGANAWGIRHTLSPALGQAGQAFGQAVGVWDGNLGVADSIARSAVGAPLYDDAGDVDAGRVAFYADATSAGQFDGADPNEQYGYSVALEAADAIAGRPSRTIAGQPGAGSVNTFTFNGTSWVTNTINLAETGASRNHFFGGSVDVSGGLAVIGTPGTLADPLNAPPGAARAGSITTLVKPGVTWTVDAKTLATYDQPFSQAEQFFGFSTAISGEWMAVGAQRDGQKGADAGAVFMYRRVAGVWTPHSKLTALFGKAGDQFGTAVALQGSRLVVGAPAADGFPTATSNAGAVYVYQFNGAVWIQTLERQSPNPTANGFFGIAASLHGDVLAVGAGGENGNIGRAYAFRDLVALSSPITLDVAASVGSGAGRSISVYDPTPGTPNDEVIAIGAYADSSGAGAAFVRTGPSFASVTTLASPAPAANRFFGHSVSIFNGRVAVGAPTATAAPSGAVYVFSGAAYASVETLAPTGSPGQFGYAVALDDSQLLVGSPASNGRAGLAHVFARSGSTWAQTDLLQPGDLATFDEFGSSVAMAGGSVAVGAPIKDGSATNSGVVYLFQPAPEVFLSPTDLSVSEAGSTTDSFTVRLSTAPSSNVTIGLTFSSAQVQVNTGAGFGASPQTVTLTPANATAGVTVTVRAIDDAIAEADPHAVTLVTASTVSADAAYSALPVDDVDVVIADNDSAGVSITQSGGSTSVSENGTTDSYTIVLDSQPSATVSLAISFPATDLTVNGDTDGTYTTTFTTGNWNTAQTLTVAAVNDRNFEADHAGALAHAFTSADADYQGITARVDGTSATNTLTAGITDNETVELRWVNATGSAAEGATYIQSVVMDITADPVGGTPQNEVAIAFEAPITLITAAAADIQIQFLAQTISAGNSDGQQFSVFHDFVDDALVEGPETFAMALNVTTPYSGLTVGTNHIATLLDGDSATVALTGGTSLAESVGTSPLTVTLATTGGSALQDAVTVALNLADGTATYGGGGGDFALTGPTNTTTVSFAAGSANGATQVLNLGINEDVLVEGTESFTASLGAVTGQALVTGSTQTLTITDNEAAVLSFVSATSSAPEGTTPHTVQAVLEISSVGAGTPALQDAVTVAIVQTPGTALTPGDYTLSDTSLSFPAAAADGSTQAISFVIVDDPTTEPAETFSLGFGAVTGAATASGTHTVTIIDNDVPGITVSESGGVTAVTEGGATDSYSVVLGSQPSADVTINIAFDSAQLVLNGDTDGLTSLTFTPVSWNIAQTVNVAALNDTVVEGSGSSSLVVQTASSADAVYGAIDPADVSVGITDNDTAEVIFSSAGFAAVEGAVFSPGMTLRVTANGAPGGSIAVPIVVDLGLTPLTASADDVSITTAQASFPAGSTHDTVVATHSLTVVDDPVVEGTEAFELDLSIASGLATTTARNAYTISDDDSATVGFVPIGVSQSEANTPMAFTVTLSNPVASGVTLAVNSTNGTAGAADFTAISGGTVSFPPNSTTAQTVSVAINNDALDEADEQFTLGLSNLVATGAVTLGAATATGTIVDDDALPVLSVADVTQPEGDAVNTLTFTVTLSAASGRDVSFSRATADGTATVADSDYVALAPGPLSIPAGQTSVSIPVTINGDTVYEGDETFSLNLTAVTHASPGTLSVTATLQEDDQETTTTEITSDDPDPSAVNAPYTVQVTVRGQTLAPAGTITVDDGTGASCGPVTLVAGTPPESSASCAITSTTAGTKTLTATYVPASAAFAASSDTEQHTVIVVAPEIAYAPATGTTVDFTGVTAIGTTGSATIVATPSGGADTGAAATTTLNGCSLGGANPGSFAGAAAISLSFIGDTTTPQNITLSCSAASTTQTATLSCSETRGTAAPVPREWPLSCPAGELLPLISTPAVGGTVQITGVVGGSTATQPITFSNPNPIEVSLSCTAPAFPFTATPLAFSIPANGSTPVSVGMSGAAPGNYSGSLSCTVAGSSQVLAFNLAGSLVPPLAVSATSHWSLIVLMLGLFGVAAVAVRRKA